MGKKNKKKSKQDEDQKDKEEEEKKDEDGIVAVPTEVADTADPLSWADDANAEDEWAFPTNKKSKKKGKKNQNVEDLLPPPPPPPPGPPTSTFQDISLEDEGPMLDVDFGRTDTKKDSGFGSFGNWGGSWDNPTTGTAASGSKKDSKSAKNDKDVDKNTDLGNNNPWSTDSKSKSKKKSNPTSGFDFGDLGPSHPKDDVDLDLKVAAETKPTETDDWGFSSVTTKDKKKKKKNALAEVLPEEPVSAFTEGEKDKEAADFFGSWDQPKKSSKKGRKEVPLVQPSTAGDAPADGAFDWADTAFGSKDKKGTKAVGQDPIADNNFEAKADPTFDWATSLSKKDKKSKKKVLTDDLEGEPILPAENTVFGDTADGAVDDWTTSAWQPSGKKKDKEGRKGVLEDMNSTYDPTMATDTSTAAPNTLVGDDDFGFGTAKSKKDKKSRKGDTKVSSPPPVPPIPEDVHPDNSWDFPSKDKETDGGAEKVEDEFSTWSPVPLSAKDKKKKDKKKKATEPVLQEANPAEDDIWDLGTKNHKKGKDEPPPPAPSPPSQGLTPEPQPATMPDLQEEDWGGLGFTSAKSSKKKGAVSKSNTLLSKSGKLDDGKAKAKTTGIDDDAVATEEKASKDETPAKATKSFWGSFSGGTTTTAKTKAAKEKEKREEEERAQNEAAEAALEEADREAAALELESQQRAEENNKSSKSSKTTGKASKGDAKSSGKIDDKKKNKDDPYDLNNLLDEPILEQEEQDQEEASPKLKKTADKAPLTKKEKAAKEKEDKAAREKEAREKEKEAKAKEKEAKEQEKEAKAREKEAKAKEKEDKEQEAKEQEAKEKEKEKEKEAKAKDSSGTDYFGSFWGGGSKKTAGKKEDPKKEINQLGSANDDDALRGLSKDLETDALDDESFPPAKPSKTMSTTATKNKGTTSSSVAAKIKAFEGGKKSDKADRVGSDSLTAKSSAAAAKNESLKEETKNFKDSPLQSPKSPTAAAATTTITSKTTTKSGKKKQVPSPIEEKSPKETVPGSFPGAFGDEDDLMAMDDITSPTVEKKSGKKSKDDKKSASKSTSKSSKTVQMQDVLMEAPEPPKLPTPPPEVQKPVKKERTRVERTGTANTWGFWGAAPTPKKDTGKKESLRSPEPEEIPKKKAAPVMSRSKSTRTPREKEREEKKDLEKLSKSSGSDSKEKSAESRPSRSGRGMSFSAFMTGGNPPSATRTKPTRRSSVTGGSKPASRRQSIDMDTGGLLSPPPDDPPEISAKAAKLMGVKRGKVERTKSAKGKERASVIPDPYAIDDDDMVLVNALEDPIINGVSSKYPPPKGNVSTPAKSKREVRVTSMSHSAEVPRPSWEPDFVKGVKADGKVSYKQSRSSKTKAGAPSYDDDVVMVDAGPSGGEPIMTSGPDDMTFVEHGAPEPKRSNTASKRTSGLFGSFFGGGGAKATKGPEPIMRSRPPSAYKDERMMDVETPATYTKDKSRRRSMKSSHTDADAPDLVSPDQEAERGEGRAPRATNEAERRRSRRDREKAELEARRTKARDRARREQEAEEQRREDKRARRAAREEARAREEADVEAAAVARRDERRRLRAELEASQVGRGQVVTEGQDEVDKSRLPSKEVRKQQFEREEADRLRRREEKGKKGSSRQKEKSGKRKSTTSPLMDEYFESRSGNPKPPGGPPDKTSSWIKSQTSDPPDLPPVEGTILDDEKPRSAAVFDKDGGEKTAGGRPRLSTKESSRRHSRYDTGAEAQDRRTSRRKESRRSAALNYDENGPKTGSGSGEEDPAAGRGHRHRSTKRGAREEYDAYADGGAAAAATNGRPLDARPTNPKRASIIGRLGGFF